MRNQLIQMSNLKSGQLYSWFGKNILIELITGPESSVWAFWLHRFGIAEVYMDLFLCTYIQEDHTNTRSGRVSFSLVKRFSSKGLSIYREFLHIHYLTLYFGVNFQSPIKANSLLILKKTLICGKGWSGLLIIHSRSHQYPVCIKRYHYNSTTCLIVTFTVICFLILVFYLISVALQWKMRYWTSSKTWGNSSSNEKSV